MPRKPPETKPRSRKQAKPALKAVPKATVSPIVKAFRTQPAVTFYHNGGAVGALRKDIQSWLDGKGEIHEDVKRAAVADLLRRLEQEAGIYYE